MKDKVMGYIICESTVDAKPEIIGEQKLYLPNSCIDNIKDCKSLSESFNSGGNSVNLVTIRTDLQDVDVVNRNGRKYYEKHLVPALNAPHIKELQEAESWFGEAGHPHKPDMGRQLTIDPTMISHKIKSTSLNGNVISGIVQAVPTQHGMAFDALVRSGSKMAFSLRAMGAVKSVGGVNEVIGPMRVVTYDWVVLPSHKVAYQTGILQESASGIILESGGMGNENLRKIMENAKYEGDVLAPVMKSGIVDYIKNNSKNIHDLSEKLEFAFDRVLLHENGNKVTLVSRNGGDKLVVFLEDYLTKDYDNFMKNLLI